MDGASGGPAPSQKRKAVAGEGTTKGIDWKVTGSIDGDQACFTLDLVVSGSGGNSHRCGLKSPLDAGGASRVNGVDLYVGSVVTSAATVELEMGGRTISAEMLRGADDVVGRSFWIAVVDATTDAAKFEPKTVVARASDGQEIARVRD